MRFNGRILILGTASDAVAKQLAGYDVSLAEAGELRTDVSTDEITPLQVMLNYDEKLAQFAHTGLVINGERPVAENALVDANIAVIVAGRRYGKGSSREHSPFAELSAGIRLVIAESFERIYRQNCDNLGIFTSTDFGLIDRIRAGEDIPIEELVSDRDPLAADILRAGGLLAYGQVKLKGAKRLADNGISPKTLAQKIISRFALNVDGLAWKMEPGTGGFVQADYRFIIEYYCPMAVHMLVKAFGHPLDLEAPDTIILFEDHLSYAHRSPTHVRLGLLDGVNALSAAHRQFADAYSLKNHGWLMGEEGSEGISHAMMIERYALPGRIVVGTDSHTPHSGALGCFAFGVGTTDMANAFMTGAIRLNMADSLLVRLEGERGNGVTAKDIALSLLALPFIRDGGGLGQIFEFVGPVIDAMSIDERATLTNMVAELGGLTGICAPDLETVRFLKERRGIEFEIEDWMHSDSDAFYAHEIVLNCSDVGPMLARPGDPGNGLSLSELENPVPVQIAYGGSCTAGKREDFDHYFEVAKWARDRQMRVADGVKLYLQCGTLDVRQYCIDQGYLDTFEAIGAELLGPACGACGQCGPGVTEEANQTVVSAINRNFAGRGGPGQVWLASPPTVVASALAGEILSFDDLKARRS
ncbi:MAG: aconitase family protein [Alphaproteobacteria bacterium]|jgi:3-isopropylmalate/(R)-2-methylmalate dehydratase large subunit